MTTLLKLQVGPHIGLHSRADAVDLLPNPRIQSTAVRLPYGGLQLAICASAPQGGASPVAPRRTNGLGQSRGGESVGLRTTQEQTFGGRGDTRRVQNGSAGQDSEWELADVASEVAVMTQTVRLVQWYPGHIARAERELKQQLKWVDCVIEVRDARIPAATTHPQLDAWIKDCPKVVVLNRQDMVSAADRKAWAEYYGQQNISFCFTDGQHGAGIMKLARSAMRLSRDVNLRRKGKGLLPRSVRAAVIGFPNVGKSALINRLLNRRVCASAPRPGVTRELKWVRMGEGLDLLDAPGVLPGRISDQAAAARLAMCNDIGEAAYASAGVAALLLLLIRSLPSTGLHVVASRYKLRVDGLSAEDILEAIADRLFQGDVDQAAQRVLKDFRKGAFGWFALEQPPRFYQ